MNITPQNIAVIGCSGAIGGAFVKHLSTTAPRAAIHAFSRQKPANIIPRVAYHSIDYTDESSLEKAAETAVENAPLDLVIVAIGILTHGSLMIACYLQTKINSQPFQSCSKFLGRIKKFNYVEKILHQLFDPKISYKYQSDEQNTTIISLNAFNMQTNFKQELPNRFCIIYPKIGPLKIFKIFNHNLLYILNI